MGCISAKDVYQSINTTIYFNPKMTNLIAFDQLFVLIGQSLKDIEEFQQILLSKRTTLINITKANLLNNPKLSDAFRLWTWGVSLCNRGNSKNQGAYYTFNQQSESNENQQLFSFSLGNCAELRFIWFGIIFSEYLDDLQKANKNVPILKNKAKDILNKIKSLKENPQYIESLSDNEKLNIISLLEYNCTKLQKSLINSDNFFNELQQFQIDVSQLQVAQDVDQWGRKLYRDLDVIQVKDDSYRMRAKMNSVVLLYYPGKKRTQEEEQFYYLLKLERSKIKPRFIEQTPNQYFNFAQRWTGLQQIDSQWSEISFILQEHNDFIIKIKTIRNKLRNILQTYRYVEDNLKAAWNIYSLQLITELKQQIIINISESFQINCEIPQNLLNTTQLFKDYFYLVQSQNIQSLNNYWSKLQIDKTWIQGSFMKLPSYKTTNPYHQYNIITNQAKNIYYFTQQLPNYIEKHQKIFQKLINEAQDLQKNGVKYFIHLEELYKQYQIDKDIDKLIKQELNRDEIISKKKVKLEKYD